MAQLFGLHDKVRITQDVINPEHEHDWLEKGTLCEIVGFKPPFIEVKNIQGAGHHIITMVTLDDIERIDYV